MKTRQEGVQTSDGNLILDNHKLSYHYDRFESWLDGDRVAPISVDMALTRSCGAMCQFCYAMVQEPQERKAITILDSKNLLDDFAEIGVKGVSLISDGESTLSPAYVPFIQHASGLGIDVGNATNAWDWSEEKVNDVLPHLTWVRFTVAAGTPERYAEIMYKDKTHTEVFDNAMKNIRYAVKLKREKRLNVTLGIQMVLMPEYADQIKPFAKLGIDLGVDYAVIKHCSDDTDGTLGVDYTKYEELTDLLEEAENMSNDQTKIIVKWSKIEDGKDCSYKSMYGPNFLLQISGSGLVAPSGMFFNAKYSKFHIGNFTEERFINIFKSEQYIRVMKYLESDRFDAPTMMGSLPIQHYLNKSIDKHLKGIQKIERATGSDNVMHVNFL
ncbi:MAG: radical SAM protein [Pelagibacteraceae bacterium TMED65]|nr:MAG: radical SAM protein [Pelagibacteraceae bacterium TMED65]|tara:strand:+ start:5385 stop:6536 length:1152 start_codon:yes stop_codon:yes gene_type:complete